MDQVSNRCLQWVSGCINVLNLCSKIALLNIEGVDCCSIISEAVNLLRKADLKQQSGTL